MESARPAFGWQRETKDAENGSRAIAVSGSARDPFTRTSSRESIRESRTKSPWEPPTRMSPEAALMAKVDSSTRVTEPVESPTDATLPEKFQGSLI